MARVVRWFDSRLGLSHEMLRPVPQYAINPFYWLGALAVIAFVIQGITGAIMLLYYVPSPTQAYASTQYIFQSVTYGTFLETVHLYTAYAMIMLAFMHMIRGYFVSVHKKPRELMWVVGMLMGVVTLGFGFTGYLLPWTVVSYSATHVGIGMIDVLPPPVSSFLSFLVVGAGGDATVLLRFFDLHVVVLPAALLVLLVVKMYMLETHGISEPVTGSEPLPEERRKLIPIFPDVSIYLLELAALFGAAMLLISVVFPLTLPPEYSAAAASQYVAQPDWYFLWIYQVVKIAAFEANGPLGQYGLPMALSVISIVFVVLFLLPFIDRSEEKRISRRPLYTTFGAIFVAEIVILACWGLLTPGETIPDLQALVVLGGTALAVSIVSLMCFKLVFGGLGRIGGGVRVSPPSSRTAPVVTAGLFASVLAVGALSIGGLLDSVVGLFMDGASPALLAPFALSLLGLALSVFGTIYLIYRLDFMTGEIRRHVRFLEVGSD